MPFSPFLTGCIIWHWGVKLWCNPECSKGTWHLELSDNRRTKMKVCQNWINHQKPFWHRCSVHCALDICSSDNLNKKYLTGSCSQIVTNFIFCLGLMKDNEQVRLWEDVVVTLTFNHPKFEYGGSREQVQVTHWLRIKDLFTPAGFQFFRAWETNDCNSFFCFESKAL